MARDKKSESKGGVVGPGKAPGPAVKEKHEPEAVKSEAKPDKPKATNGSPKVASEQSAKPAPAAPEKTEAKPPSEDKGKAKAAPGTTKPAAPHAVGDDDDKAPSPDLVQIPPETKAGERENLLRPDQIDTTVAPETKAPAPGRAPRGDARSLRRAQEFCLIYRQNQFLIRREGKVGTLGNWSIVEYPSPAAAAHAYAQECSELSGSGFDDHRP